MLAVSGLSFSYNAGREDAIPALRDVDIQIQPGELVAIIGHNGSGKSTLARLMAAMLEPTSGTITVDTIPSDAAHVWDVRRRVAMVFQHPDDQFIANTVIDDIAFGPENLGLPRDEINRRIALVTDALELRGIIDGQISELSGGEKQRVAIAGVLAMQPAYVVLDEPTTMIPPQQARDLLALIRRLREQQGLAFVHITHFMHEVVHFDRVIVMDGGRVLMQGTPRQVFARADEVRAVGLDVPLATSIGRALAGHGVAIPETLLTADELADVLAPYTTSATPPTRAPAAPLPERPPLLRVHDLHFTYLAGTPMARAGLRGASCTVYEGETLAILGGTQAGKSTLIEFFNGLRKPQPGHVWFAERDIAAPDFDIATLRDAVGVVFQQPEAQLFEETVGKDVSFVPRRRGLAPAESRALVEQALEDVGLDYERFRLRYVYALSGGQKRRVAIAGVLAAQPRMIIFDEPIAGLDPRGRVELARLLGRLARREGLTVVLVSNTVDELAELADRALVMHQGVVVREGPLRTLLRDAEHLHGLGLELSEPAEMALVLRRVLPGLPTDVLQEEELLAALLTILGPSGRH